MIRFWLAVRQSLCRGLLGKSFFNADASREIDRLTAEVERLTLQLRKEEGQQQ